MKRLKSFLIVFASLFLFIQQVGAAYSDAEVGSYESELAKFPLSYKAKIEALHQIYPNAIFVAQDKFFDYSPKTEVAVDWSRMLSYEYYIPNVSALSYNGRSRNLIYYTFNVGYRSYDSWSYNYKTDEYSAFDNGNWYAAAKKTVEYYLDPRNFLDENNIFIFESLFGNTFQDAAGVEKIVANTFMANKECAGSSGKTYAQVILEASQANDVSAYYLAARLRQEQGVNGTSQLISGNYPGYEGYYNYFNVGASGTGVEITINGLNTAKARGWTTPYKAIVEGAEFAKQKYVGINDAYNVKGQLTLYLNKWDPFGYALGNHQYMQNITAPISEASSVLTAYKLNSNYRDNRYIFYIPVYANMPSETSLAAMGSPNNYLSSLKVNGNSVNNFDGDNTNYSYTVASGTTQVNIDYTKVNSYASVSGAGVVDIPSNGIINLLVTAQNGDKRTYTVTIQRDDNVVSIGEIVNSSPVKSDGTYFSGIALGTNMSSIIDSFKSISSAITVVGNNGSKNSGMVVTGDTIKITNSLESKTYTIIINGDVNGDGKIAASDYVLIKNHIMGKNTLSGAYAKAADINKDSNIKASDYVLVKNHILGKYSISQ